jgi:class 3 adenylate cyclase/YHS domain-containing protein
LAAPIVWSDPEPHPESSTFVFADLAGFTALTEAHGDDEAIEIALQFVDRVRKLLPDYRAEEVKAIGDELMIRVEDPVRAVQLGRRIVDELAFHCSPPVRVGMHTGAATRLNGDWYGATVNLASRVVDAAKPGEVLFTAATRRELEGRDGFAIEERGTRRFKHVVDPVPVYEALAAGGEAKRLEIDPVCRMAVDPDRAASSRKRLGLSYYFCSQDCREKFDAGPKSYIATTAGARAARIGFLINLSAFLIVGGVHLASWVARDFTADSPGMFILFWAWAVALVFHYRTVRRVL